MPLSEKALIATIRQHAYRMSPRSRHLAMGIGDDCAVVSVPPRHELLVTTDFSLEGVHFRRDWHSAEVIGHRCLTRGLSDIAAMGGEPLAAFLSLALPGAMPQRWVDGFIRGLLRLAKSCDVPLAGGDTAQSPSSVLADIVVVGSVPRGTAILRSGARPGDQIYVTGELGGSAAVIDMLRRAPRTKLRAEDFPHHFHPVPRIEAGRFLREQGLASAMIDVSDGLSTDLAHICKESAVGAQIRAELIPRAHIGKGGRLPVEINSALHGGDDYELLFTASARKRIPARIGGVPITCIGAITRGCRLFLVQPDGRREPLIPQGWEHFRKT